MGAPLLIDVSCLCDTHTDDALELIHKAIGEDPPVDIWAPHPNPYIRRIVELFTSRGLDRISGLQQELTRWLHGEMQLRDLERPVRPAGAMERWSRAELGLVRLYLQSLPPREFTLDDWMMLVDYLAQRYLPASDLRSEADWLVTRSALMGRVQAASGSAREADADALLASLPMSIEDVARTWGMTPAHRAVIDFGRARACDFVTGLADTARRRMRRLIADHQEAVYLGDRSRTMESLQTQLLDNFGLMNRDWRRIAVTEATECANQGFVASMQPGAKLRRVEKYRGACPFCRSIDGRVVTVVDPSAPKKDGETQVWLGKTNIGRSASPTKRAGGQLVEREPHEMWWLAAGAMHPNCRGAWVKVAEGASEDPEFEAWLANMDRTRGRS